MGPADLSSTSLCPSEQRRQPPRRPVDGLGAERRQADRDVLGALGAAGVADPLARLGDDALAGLARRSRAAVVVDDAPSPREDDGDLVELRGLERLVQSGRGVHVGDGHRLAGRC